MKQFFVVVLVITGLSTNAQKMTPGTQKITAKKPSSTQTKIITSVLKPLESLSDIQIANALYVEIGLDKYGGADDDILKSYMSSSSKIVNVAEIIHNRKKYYLVDRLYGDDFPYGNNRDSYEDKDNVRSTVANSLYSGDDGSGSESWVFNFNQDEVNKFRISTRNKAPIKLVASTISVMCQKEGDSIVETLQIGNELVSQHFIKGTHSYILSVDRSGKVNSIQSRDLISNYQHSDNYNICSERLITKLKNFKFKDDLDAPVNRRYKVTIVANVKNNDSNAVKFVHNDRTYLSDSDPGRKFYTDSIRLLNRMNDAVKDLKLVESRRDSIGKSVSKNRQDILEEFKTNYASYVEKDRQRLLKEEWGGKLDPRTTSYDRTLEMILDQARANTNEKYSNLESSSERDLINRMENINEEYEQAYNIYIDLKTEYELLKIKDKNIYLSDN